MRVGVMKDSKLKMKDLHVSSIHLVVVYYETINREPKIKPNSECRCDDGLKTKVEESTCR
jgi:hypothetical protein